MSRTNHHGNKKKLKLFGDSWQWLQGAPKAWRKAHKHKPQRAAASRCRHQTMTEDPENVIWPHDSKPEEYYW